VNESGFFSVRPQPVEGHPEVRPSHSEVAVVVWDERCHESWLTSYGHVCLLRPQQYSQLLIRGGLASAKVYVLGRDLGNVVQ